MSHDLADSLKITSSSLDNDKMDADDGLLGSFSNFSEEEKQLRPRASSLFTSNSQFSSRFHDVLMPSKSPATLALLVDDETVLEMSHFDFDKQKIQDETDETNMGGSPGVPSSSASTVSSAASMTKRVAGLELADFSFPLDSLRDRSQSILSTGGFNMRDRSSSILSSGSVFSALRNRGISLDLFPSTEVDSMVGGTRPRGLSLEFAMLPTSMIDLGDFDDQDADSNLVMQQKDLVVDGHHFTFVNEDEEVDVKPSKDASDEDRSNTRGGNKDSKSKLRFRVNPKGPPGDRAFGGKRPRSVFLIPQDKENSEALSTTRFRETPAKATLPTGKQLLVYLRAAVPGDGDNVKALDGKDSTKSGNARGNNGKSTKSSSSPSRKPDTSKSNVGMKSHRTIGEAHPGVSLDGQYRGVYAPLPVGKNGKSRMIGGYTLEQRRQRIIRFLEKRKNRVWMKKVKYGCRKKLADSRPRVKGRFVPRLPSTEGGEGTADSSTNGASSDMASCLSSGPPISTRVTSSSITNYGSSVGMTSPSPSVHGPNSLRLSENGTSYIKSESSGTRKTAQRAPITPSLSSAVSSMITGSSARTSTKSSSNKPNIPALSAAAVASTTRMSAGSLMRASTLPPHSSSSASSRMYKTSSMNATSSPPPPPPSMHNQHQYQQQRRISSGHPTRPLQQSKDHDVNNNGISQARKVQPTAHPIQNTSSSARSYVTPQKIHTIADTPESRLQSSTTTPYSRATPVPFPGEVTGAPQTPKIVHKVVPSLQSTSSSAKNAIACTSANCLTCHQNSQGQSSLASSNNNGAPTQRQQQITPTSQVFQTPEHRLTSSSLNINRCPNAGVDAPLEATPQGGHVVRKIASARKPCSSNCKTCYQRSFHVKATPGKASASVRKIVKTGTGVVRAVVKQGSNGAIVRTVVKSSPSIRSTSSTGTTVTRTVVRSGPGSSAGKPISTVRTVVTKAATPNGNGKTTTTTTTRTTTYVRRATSTPTGAVRTTTTTVRKGSSSGSKTLQVTQPPVKKTLTNVILKGKDTPILRSSPGPTTYRVSKMSSPSPGSHAVHGSQASSAPKPSVPGTVV